MEVTAEGVENARQIIELQAFDCTYAQGYLFARPLACSEATRLLEANVPLLPEGHETAEDFFRWSELSAT